MVDDERTTIISFAGPFDAAMVIEASVPRPLCVLSVYNPMLRMM